MALTRINAKHVKTVLVRNWRTVFAEFFVVVCKGAVAIANSLLDRII